ncbi:MAG: phosphoribosyltransferase domain-containing protein [bacterium]|nr:phosphoribosyltransferase domain-containing protein [bacterium]
MQKQQRDYTSNDLVRVAKRENNKKRTYLIVNPCQGKHIPVSPAVANEVFDLLGQKVNATVKEKEKVLVIAFAETATAIGAGIARNINQEVSYIQTTREDVEGAEYLYFSESHSHATEQRLVKNGLKELLQQVDKIVFAEDEVTTGNTICNLIRELETLSGGKTYQYVIASLLNGMTKEVENSFKENQREVLYLIKTDNAQYEQMVDKFVYDGLLLRKSEENTIGKIPVIQIGNKSNPRKLVSSKEYEMDCKEFASEVMKQISIKEHSKVLVLGTEEFMYPALCVAREIEQAAGNGYVSFHATTRSPILTCSHSGYPLSSRIELRSLYEEERCTYVYNLKKYEQVLLITDARVQGESSLNTVLHALETAGNTNIMLVEWRN